MLLYKYFSKFNLTDFGKELIKVILSSFKLFVFKIE